jgi:serine/threonine-protein kinase
MNLRGPYVTLVAGLAVAGVVAAMSVDATSDATAEAAARAAAAASPAPSPGASRDDGAPSPTPPAPAPTRKAVYAGRVDGGAATVAVSVKGDKAIAYVCDGNRVEAWMSGTVTGDRLTLGGDGNASLTAEIQGGRLAGTVSAKRKSWTFDVARVRKPSGLYQAAANVAGARVVGSWIVLPDGTQVGVLATDGEPGPAPEFDEDSATVAVDGGSLIVLPVGPDGN